MKLLEQSGHAENEHALQLTNLGYCLADVGRTAEGRKVLQESVAEISRLHMRKRWLSEPLAALANLEFAAGNKKKAVELVKRAIAALDGEQGSDVIALRQYEAEQLTAWTK